MSRSRVRRLHGHPVNLRPGPGPWVTCVMARRAGPDPDDWSWCSSPAWAAYVPSDARDVAQPVYVEVGTPGTFPVCEGCAPVLARSRVYEPDPGAPTPRQPRPAPASSLAAEVLDVELPAVEPASPLALGGILAGVLARTVVRRSTRGA